MLCLRLSRTGVAESEICGRVRLHKGAGRDPIPVVEAFSSRVLVNRRIRGRQRLCPLNRIYSESVRLLHNPVSPERVMKMVKMKGPIRSFD